MVYARDAEAEELGTTPEAGAEWESGLTTNDKRPFIS
jgi:hypothetical protein